MYGEANGLRKGDVRELTERKGTSCRRVTIVSRARPAAATSSLRLIPVSVVIQKSQVRTL